MTWEEIVPSETHLTFPQDGGVPCLSLWVVQSLSPHYNFIFLRCIAVSISILKQTQRCPASNPLIPPHGSVGGDSNNSLYEMICSYQGDGVILSLAMVTTEINNPGSPIETFCGGELINYLKYEIGLLCKVESFKRSLLSSSKKSN